jgi:hypothetical protein
VQAKGDKVPDKLKSKELFPSTLKLFKTVLGTEFFTKPPFSMKLISDQAEFDPYLETQMRLVPETPSFHKALCVSKTALFYLSQWFSNQVAWDSPAFTLKNPRL